MSIYATWLTIQDPNEWVEELKKEGIKAGFVGDYPDEEEELGSPWVYQGSHHLPSITDERRGCVEVAGIPDFITRDGEDEGTSLNDWLRLSVNDCTVVLNRSQVTELCATLIDWYFREPE